jgi:TrmH family RNA methyltransferase
LLTNEQRDRFEVVLVSPRNPLNIGAAARAMANFGFAHLSVVAPYEPHWREAKSAVGAESLLLHARGAQCLNEAVADCTLVIGTGTLEHRKPEQPVVPLPSLAPLIQDKEKIAIVFGPEKRGLTREDLALCHLLVEIPTDPRQPSMNLGQAVAVCLYEFTRQSRSLPSQSSTAADAPSLDSETRANETSIVPAPATAADLDLLAGVVTETMQAANYSPAAMQRANRHDLDLLLRRLTLSGQDVRRILGLFRRILWRIKH